MNSLFANPEFLLLGLLALAVLGAGLYWAEQAAWKRLHAFAESGLLRRLTRSHSRQRLWVKNTLLLLVVLLLFASLARPQWGADWETAETRGIDIMIALDTSSSMLAEDITPNRLERAKLAILDLLETVRGDRIGLIAFAGNAFLQCPLTLDYQAFRQTMAAIDTNTIPVGGTDVAAAIGEAEAYFESTDNERILILITDGEDLEASGVARAREAAGKGTRILTVGVGSPEGELIPLTGPDGRRDFLRDANGKPVSTKLDEDTLRRIAAASNGLYAPLGATGNGLDQVYQYCLAQMPAQNRRESLQRIPIERFRWPLLAALVLLVAESLLTTRRRDNARKGAARLLPLLPFGLALNALAPGDAQAGAAEDAAKAYREERYEESVTLYGQAVEAEPQNRRYLYNLGVSAYRAGRYEEAIASFEKTLRLADTGLQAKAFHNSGNSRVAYGFAQLEDAPSLARDQWQAALTDYGNALALDAGRANTRQNLAQLQATIAAHTYTLTTTAEPAGAGTVSPGGQAFHLLPFPVTATAADGWRFTGWTGAGVENPEQAETVVRMKADTAVAAQFVKTWKLTVLSADESMGTAGTSGVYRADEPVTIKAEPRDYFAFSRWSSQELSFPDPRQAEMEITLTGDATVTASFVPAFKLTVELDPEIGGKAGPSGFFEEFSVVPIQAEPRPGFEWVGWIGDGIKEPDAQQTSITMTGDRVAIARMDRVWSLVIIPLPEEGGSVEGAGDHPVGSTVDISATPLEGFTFEGWDGPGVEDPASPQTRVTVESRDHTLYARFKQDNQENQDNQEQRDQQQDNQEQQDQQESGDDQQQDNPDQQEPQDQQDQDQQDQEPQPEEESPPQESAGQPAEEEPAAPGEMTREEARQLLNALSESEKYLPAGERSRQPASAPTGRNW